MASDSEGDLEDGELPSSEDETEEIKKDEIDKPDTVEPGVDAISSNERSSLKRPFESTEGDNEEEKDSRDTPTSPSAKVIVIKHDYMYTVHVLIVNILIGVNLPNQFVWALDRIPIILSFLAVTKNRLGCY